jgi:polar amino acid transport system substrate-binding protein
MDRRAVVVGLAATGVAFEASGAAMKPDADVIKSLAPTGRLRAAINLGNGVLAQKDEKTGALGGVSFALANELAKRLGVPLEPVVYDAAGKVFAGMDKGEWDVAFMAAEPERAAMVAFTAPYVIIEGTYLVRDASPYHTVADLDRDGIHVTVGKGSAYALYLQRNLKRATLVESSRSDLSIDAFKADTAMAAAAGVRQALVAAASKGSGYRVLPDSYQKIEQAMGTPKDRVAGARYLKVFIEEMKATPFIRDELKKSGQDPAVAAPSK